MFSITIVNDQEVTACHPVLAVRVCTILPTHAGIMELVFTDALSGSAVSNVGCGQNLPICIQLTPAS